MARRFVLLALLALLAFASLATAPTHAFAGAQRSLVLSEGWLFQPDPLDAGTDEGWQRPDFDRSGWRPVTVPAAWDSYGPSMDGYEGVGWYAYKLPATRIDAAAWQRLRFGRANHKATVWIDGHEAGEDSLGYLPFEIAATPHLQEGHDAWIVLRVRNGVRYDWLPGTTTVEWVQYGGLLQPVELVTTPRVFVRGVAIDARPDGTDGRLDVMVSLENASDTEFAGVVRIEGPAGRMESDVRVSGHGTAAVRLEPTMSRPKLWNPGAPSQYELTASLLDGDKRSLDRVTEKFGVRSIEARGRELLLNGVSLRIRGVNRYDEFPGVGPVATDEQIRADLKAIQRAGGNLVRVHYPQSPALLRIADELGMLVMEEVPLNWWRASWHPRVPDEYDDDRIVDSAERALERMIERDANHPSVIIWSVSNECQTSDARGVRAMERLLKRAKALDPSRLVTYVANQAYEKNAAFEHADLVAVNLYYGMWDGDEAETIAGMDSLVTRPTSAELEEIAKLFPDKPILLSEFGTIGVPGMGGATRFGEDYQAAYVAAVWKAVRERPEVCGGVVWSWADYRHRRGFENDFPAFYGPFGLVTIERKPKKALGALSAEWRRGAADEPTAERSPER